MTDRAKQKKTELLHPLTGLTDLEPHDLAGFSFSRHVMNVVQRGRPVGFRAIRPGHLLFPQHVGHPACLSYRRASADTCQGRLAATRKSSTEHRPSGRPRWRGHRQRLSHKDHEAERTVYPMPLCIAPLKLSRTLHVSHLPVYPSQLN